MNHQTTGVRLARGTAAMLTALLLLSAIPARAASLSPALDIIAAEHPMARCGISGTDITFTREDFAASLGVKTVGKITVTGLPDLTLGHLMLGDQYVGLGQSISEKNLDKLRFVPYGDREIETEFTFCRGGDPFGPSVTCSLYALDTVNTAPVIRTADSVSTLTGSDAVTVYSGTVHLGTVPAYDAEGDAMTFEILQYPSHGTLRLTNRAHGYYEYTADADFTGADSFTVRATDRYGNRSAETRILLHAEKVSSDEVFADMDGHWASAAAITCVRTGVLDAPASGDCLYPEEPVSRAEFLALAMRAAGYEGFSANLTGFADEADIPAPLRGYAAAASALGIVTGVETDAGLMLYPNHQITRSEAALILARLTGIAASSVTVFADDAVPAWASGAVSGLMEAGILRGSGDGFDGYSTLTRAAAVQLAAAITGRK